MKIDKKTILQTLLFAVIGVGLVVWRYQVLSAEDKQAMFHAFGAFRWSLALPIFGVGLLSHIIRAKRWELQFKALQIPYNSFNTFSAVMMGYLTNIFVPRLGEVSKCTVIAKYNGGPVDKIIGTVIAERLWDTICFGVLTIITLAVEFDILMPYAVEIWNMLLQKNQTTDGSWNWTNTTMLLVVMIIGLGGGVYFIKKSSKTSKVGGFIQGVLKGLQSIYKVPQKSLFICYTLLLWFCYTAIAIMVFKAIPVTAILPLTAGLSIITFGTFAMIVPAPGAIAYPVIVAPILTLYGLSAGVGQGYGWINWANQNIVVIILGLFVMIALPIYNSKKNNDKIRNTSA
jgi:hypothetical protein